MNRYWFKLGGEGRFQNWFLTVLGCSDENFIVLFHSPKINSASQVHEFVS